MTIAFKPNADGTAELLVNGNKALTFSEQGAVGGALPFSFRNKIINGNFDIWQRGTTSTASAYSADRWNANHAGSTKTNSQQAFPLGQTDVPNNPKFFNRTVVTSVVGSGAYTALQQRLEGVSTFAGKAVTLSFYAKADTAKSIAVDFRQEFGASGSAAIDSIGAQRFNLTTVWQKFKTTVDIPSIAGKTLGTSSNDHLELTFWFDAGSALNSRTVSLGNQSGTFDIAQVQLEEGSVATEFEQRPIGLEIFLCQRYYCTFPYIIIDVSGKDNQIVFPARMRATPTVTGGGSGFAFTAANAVNNSGMSCYQTARAAQTINASAEL